MANPSIRSKLYLIILSVSVILFAVSVWMVKPVTVELSHLIGLASALHPTYWIGLVLVAGCAVFAFLDEKTNRDALFVAILLVLGLFLIGLPVFVMANPLGQPNYWPLAQVTTVLETGHIDPAGLSLGTYYSWPAIHYTSASIMGATGVDLGFFQYMPLWWTLSFVILSYAIGKRLGLSPRQCFLISLLPLAAYFTNDWGYFPMANGVLLYLLIFMVVVSHDRGSAVESLIFLLAFSALVMTHGFASMAALVAVVAVGLWQRRVGLAVISLVLFFSWNLYQAPGAFAKGIEVWLAEPFYNIFFAASRPEYLAAGFQSVARIVTRNGKFVYAGIYALLALTSVVSIFWRRVGPEYRRHAVAVIAWLAGLSLLLFIPWGGEWWERVYVFGLVPIVVLVVVIFSRWKKLMVAVVIGTVALFVPAQYGALAGYGQFLDVEHAGSEFFANHAHPEEGYFNPYELSIILFHNPDMARLPVLTPSWTEGLRADQPDEIDVSLLDSVTDVIISRQGYDRMYFSIGYDPFTEWTASQAANERSITYTNGHFTIYHKQGTID